MCISKVSVEITDAAAEVGTSNFIGGWFGCLLEVEIPGGNRTVEVNSGKETP